MPVDGLTTANYSARNATQDRGGITLARPLLISNDDVVRFEARRVGDVCNIVAAQTWVYLADLARPKGGPSAQGPPGDAHPFVTTAYAATTIVNLTDENHQITVTGKVTLDASNLNEGKAGSILLTLDGAHSRVRCQVR